MNANGIIITNFAHVYAPEKGGEPLDTSWPRPFIERVLVGKLS